MKKKSEGCCASFKSLTLLLAHVNMLRPIFSAFVWHPSFTFINDTIPLPSRDNRMP
jgi:hypothetical protein